MVQPVAWNLFPGCVDDRFREVGDEVKPGLEGVERADFIVDGSAEIDPLQGRICKYPVGAVERESVVYHLGEEADAAGRVALYGRPGLGAGTEEDGLAGVGITHPFVEDEDTKEVDTVLDFGKQLIGQKVEDGDAVGMDSQPGTEVDAGQNRHAPGPDEEVEVGILLDEIGTHLHERGFGHVDL